MSTTPASLDSLPAEILARIFKPLLQHTAEQADKWSGSAVLEKDRSYAQIMSIAPPEGKSLQPQVLRVCKRFNEIRTRLLYANNVVVMAHACTYYADENGAEIQRQHLKKLTLPRDDRHRLKRLYLIIYTPDFFTFSDRDTDGDWLDELFAALALHQPCWDEINITLADLTLHATYGRDRRLRGPPASIPGSGDKDLNWCMEQPEHKYPLRVLHDYLDEYFDLWKLNDVGGGQIPPRREEIMHWSLQAVESHDEDGFFVVMEEAIEHVNTTFRQDLENDASTNDYAEKALKMCQDQGSRLLSARDKKWRAAYRPKIR